MINTIVAVGLLPSNGYITGAALSFWETLRSLESSGGFKFHPIHSAFFTVKFPNIYPSHCAFFLGPILRFLDIIYLFILTPFRLITSRCLFLCLSTNTCASLLKDVPLIFLAKFVFCRYVVLVLHSGKTPVPANPFLGVIYRMALQQADYIVTISSGFRSLFDFIDNQEKVVTISNCPPSSTYDNIQPIHSLSDISNPQILYLSNLISSKGYLHLIESILYLNYVLGFRCTLNICGFFVDSAIPADMNILSKVCPTALSACTCLQDLKLVYNKVDPLKRINFIGPVTHNAKQAYLESADLFCLPTYYDIEGLPLSALEAMANGLPLITTKWRSLGDLVNIDGLQNGLLLENRDPRVLATSILEILSNPTDYTVISRNSRHLYLRYFSHSSHVSAYIDLFNSLS